MQRLPWLVLLLLPTFAQAQSTQPTTRPDYRIGQLTSPATCESSALVASRKFPETYWTLNDSGNPPCLFAIKRTGELINTFVVDATNRDWEDLAIDEAGHLYIAEIGNNERKSRQIAVYQVAEPDPNVAQKKGERLPRTATWQLRFPIEPFDAESLFIWKDSGYIISKLRSGGYAGLYRFDLAKKDSAQVLEHVVDLPLRAPVTSAAIASDGAHLAVQTVFGPYLFKFDGDFKSLKDASPGYVGYFEPTLESICFVKEGLLATTESRMVLLFPYESFGVRFKECKP